jgi:hypothetical protein
MNEKEFSEKLKPWLERSASSIGEMQSVKLKAARLRALDAWREPVRLFGFIPMSPTRAQAIQYGVVQRAMLLLPILLLLTFLAVQSLDDDGADIGDLDAQLLGQELPPDAFLDQEFKSWLSKPRG